MREELEDTLHDQLVQYTKGELLAEVQAAGPGGCSLRLPHVQPSRPRGKGGLRNFAAQAGKEWDVEL